jgi:hypothetical protein
LHPHNAEEELDEFAKKCASGYKVDRKCKIRKPTPHKSQKSPFGVVGFIDLPIVSPYKASCRISSGE